MWVSSAVSSPGAAGPSTKKKFVFPGLGGLSGSCPILGERHLSNWTLDPIQCVFPWDLGSVTCQVEPPALLAAPLQ